jgi:glutamine cyclotransferase
MVAVLGLMLSACTSINAPSGTPIAAVTDTPAPTVTPAPTFTPTPTPAPSVCDTPASLSIPVYSYQVVNAYPHDPAAFTQGLVWDQDVLYEGTGLNGRSSLRRVDLASGEVLHSQALSADYFGEGITVWEDRIIQLTWTTHVGFVYDKATFQQIGQFEYPTEGWGLTHDGEYLIMSDGTAIVHFLDPDTFEEVRQVEVRDENGPVFRLNELEYVCGEIWANIWQTDRIARIDPDTGQVVGWIDLTWLLNADDRSQPVDVLNGIAYDAEHDRLFVTGKLWPRLFEIRLVPQS